MKPVKPPRLKKGDVIGLVAPASTPSSNEKIEKGVQYLERLGYRVKVGKYVHEVLGYLAGTDEQRAGDLNDMLRDRTVRAIFALRGGYGTPRILSRIDFSTARRDPKIVVGYSDLTALQLAMFRKTGLVTFSGPMVSVEMWNSIDPYTEEHFWRLITSSSKIGTLNNPETEPLVTVRPGKGVGRLLGGNFSLLVSLMGTPFLPDLRKAILLLEEVDEAPHRVDRMFAQMKNAGVLNGVAGILIGKFTDCIPTDASKPHLTIAQVLEGLSQEVKCPVLSNLQYGHIPKKLTIPIGLKAKIDAGKRHIEIQESGVQ
ncbi:MAG: LD-carboxypeptidase [Ignavibacteriales bacterium]|nr:LD-carboxypeptidase [Ignavibacteriales bacterium]